MQTPHANQTSPETLRTLLAQTQKHVQALRGLSAQRPALSTDEIIERGLLLAKLDPTDEEVQRIMLYSYLMEFEGIASDSEPEEPDVLREAWNIIRDHRRAFRDRLKEIIKSPVKARMEHRSADVEALHEGMLIVSGWNDEGGFENRFYPQTIKAFYTHVLVLLYGRENERWRRLRKCGRCNSIFIRKRSEVGGRPRDYCTAECQEKNDQQRALIRQKSPEQRAKQRERRKRNRKK